MPHQRAPQDDSLPAQGDGEVAGGRDGQRRVRAARAAHRRLVAVVLVALAGACSGASLPARAPRPRPTTQAGWVRALEARVRRGDDRAAVRAATAARSFGALDSQSLALEAIARTRLGESARAAELARTALARARRSGEHQDWAAVERLVAFHAMERRDPATAWALLAPTRAQGCEDPRACALHARLLVHWAEQASAKAGGSAKPRATASALTHDALRARLREARPRLEPAPRGKTSRPQAARWQAGVVRALVDRRLWASADTVVHDLISLSPRSAHGWAAWMYAVRRRRGPHHRREWLAALVRAKLPAAALRGVAARTEVQADPVLVAQVWRQVLARPDASDDDRVAFVDQLVQNHRRTVTLTPVTELRRLARGFRGTTRLRNTLVRALLITGDAKTAAALLGPRTALTAPDELVLHADLARLRGELPAARVIAKTAYATAKDKAQIASALADLWLRALPKDAAEWRRRAAQHGGGGGLAAQRLRALAELGRYRPRGGAERNLLSYAAALNQAQRDSGAGRRAVDQQRRAFVAKLLTMSGRSSWRGTVQNTLSVLARGPAPTVATLYGLARVSYRLGRGEAGLAAWRAAAALAEKQGRRLDRETLLRALLARGRAKQLAVWLEASGTRGVDDVSLAWRVARTLLRGPYKLLGRAWVAHGLRQVVGEGDATLRLPALHQGTRSRRRRPPHVSTAELIQLARGGAADLLLTFVHELRSRSDASDSPKVRFKYGVAEVAALIHLGQRDRAATKLRSVAALGSLNHADQRTLLSVAQRGGLCQVVVELSERLVAMADRRTFRAALDAGLACAQRLGNTPAAYAIAARVTRAQLRLDNHLHMAMQLERYGFTRMSAHFFDQILRKSSRRTGTGHLRTWARALLAEGRVPEAVAALKQSTVRYRRRAQTFLSAARVLQRAGQLAASHELLELGLRHHATDAALRLALVQARMRLGRTDDLAEQLRALTTAGASRGQWATIVSTAMAQGQLIALHNALLTLQDHGRELDRVRVQVAALVGDRRVVMSALRRLRAKGPIRDRALLDALRQVGAWREARDVSEDLLTHAQPRRWRGPTTSVAPDLAKVRAALRTRRDPTSRTEALGLARLYVGRSLDPGIAARASSSAMSTEGYVQEARALGSLAVEELAEDELLLCEQGRVRFDAGRPAEAMALWQRAVAGTLTQPTYRRRRHGELPAAMTCLKNAAADAGVHRALGEWLRAWRDLLPEAGELWTWSVRARVNANDIAGAVALLRDAETRLSSWQEDAMYGSVAALLRRGGGPLLLKWLVETPDQLRADPWWLAVALRVANDYGEATDPAVQRLKRTIHTLAANLPAVRVRLTLETARHTGGSAAVRMLGEGPLDLPPPKRTHLSRSKPKDLAARAAAAALISLLRFPERSVAGDAAASVAPAAGLAPKVPPAVRAVMQRWLRSGGIQAAIRLAHELTLQGHPTLAETALTLAPAARDVRLSSELEMQRLRVLAATGDSDVLVHAATRVLTGHTKMQIWLRQSRTLQIAEVSSRLVAWGRPAEARAFLALQPAWARAHAPATLRPAPQQAGIALTRALRAHNAAALAQLRKAEVVATSSLGPGVVAAMAAGDTGLARRLTRAAAARSDEPWRAWHSLAIAAVQHESWSTARAAVAKARRSGAPVGALACSELHLGVTRVVEGCRQGRALRVLDDDALVAMAVGLARTADPKVWLGLRAEAQAAGVRWLAALAAALPALEGPARARAAAMAKDTIAATTDATDRRRLVNVGLDDLAALGVTQPGLDTAKAAFAREPRGHGHRNNLGYARLLAGESGAAVLGFVLPALGWRAGRAADALLDTVAAALAEMGRRDDAMRVQRWSLVASRTDSRLGQLPMLRQAAFLAGGGRCDDARAMALGALRRARAVVAIVDASPALQSVRPDAHARFIGTRAQVNGLLRRCAQVEAKSAQPAAQAPSPRPAATPAPDATARAAAAAAGSGTDDSPAPKLP